MDNTEKDSQYSKMQTSFHSYILISVILFFMFFYIGWRFGTANGIKIGIQTGWNQHSIELAGACKTGKKFMLTNGEKGWHRCSSVSPRHKR